MQNTGIEICQTARKIYQYLNFLFEPYGVTPEQWIVIKALLDGEILSQKELSLKVKKDQNTTKAIVDKLVAKELINREDNPQDRRAFLLSLTPKATALAPKLEELDAQMLLALHSGIQPHEIKTFLDILERLKNNLTF